MNNLKKQLHKLKNISLSKSERAKQWEEIRGYAEFNPLSDERVEALNRLPSTKPKGFALFTNVKTMPVIASFLVLFLGGGSAFAAEGAVPGDILYPIKTQVNENVRGAFALDDEAQASFEAWRAERRLDEARALSARAEFSEEKKAHLEERFDRHAERVETRIANIAETNPALAADLSTRFEASLLAHEAILADLNGTTTAEVRDAIRVKIDSVASLREKAVTDVTVDAPAAVSIDRASAAKRMYGSAQKALEETKELYARVQSELTESEIARIDGHFENTLSVFTRAETAYQNEEYGTAFIGFQKVVGAMNNLAVFLKGQYKNEDSPSELPIIRFKEIDPTDPLPLPMPLPVPPEIISDEPTTDPVRVESDTKTNTETETQIDPPSLQLDTGPVDTSIQKRLRLNADTQTKLRY